MMELEESYGAYFVQMRGGNAWTLLVELGTDEVREKKGGWGGGRNRQNRQSCRNRWNL